MKWKLRKRRKDSSNDFSDVDLSKNRVFDERKNELTSLIDQLHKVYEPFSTEKAYSQKGLVLTGDIKERKAKEWDMTFCDGKTCDRCGAPLQVWEHNTLCNRCIGEMKKDPVLRKIQTGYVRKDTRLS